MYVLFQRNNLLFYGIPENKGETNEELSLKITQDCQHTNKKLCATYRLRDTVSFRISLQQKSKSFADLRITIIGANCRHSWEIFICINLNPQFTLFISNRPKWYKVVMTDLLSIFFKNIITWFKFTTKHCTNLA